MRKILTLLSLLWLGACTMPLYTPIGQQSYYALGNSWAYADQYSAPAYTIEAGSLYTVVGVQDDWYIVESSGRRFWVPHDALCPTSAKLPVDPARTIAPRNRDALVAAPRPPTFWQAVGLSRQTYIGPRGGEYYINGNGNRTYLTPQSTIDENVIYTGPRGGRYYMNGNGRKTYIKH